MDSPGVINAYTISLAKVGAFFAIQSFITIWLLWGINLAMCSLMPQRSQMVYGFIL
jgi:hypothetical protein